MKRYSRLLLALLLGFTLICFSSCGDSEPAPSDDSPSGDSPSDDGDTADRGEKKQPVAEGWGHLKGRFVVTGTLPKLTPPKITQDMAYCQSGKFNVPNEEIVVGKGNALANVVIYLWTKPKKVHEDYAKDESDEITLDNKQCRFEPHVCLLRTTQKLKIGNPDPVSHNTNIQSPIQPSNNLITAGGSAIKELGFVERLPATVSCNVHPWMRCYLLVRDNPYMAVTDKEGRFEIKHLPSGELEFQAWHEKSGYLAIGDWDRGRFTVTIEPDKTNDLGDRSVPAALFEN